MATTTKIKEEQIFVQIGDEVIELIGKEKEAFLEQRAKDQVEADARKAESDARKKTRLSALTKLGLTEEELASIL